MPRRQRDTTLLLLVVPAALHRRHNIRQTTLARLGHLAARRKQPVVAAADLLVDLVAGTLQRLDDEWSVPPLRRHVLADTVVPVIDGVAGRAGGDHAAGAGRAEGACAAEEEFVVDDAGGPGLVPAQGGAGGGWGGGVVEAEDGEGEASGGLVEVAVYDEADVVEADGDSGAVEMDRVQDEARFVVVPGGEKGVGFEGRGHLRIEGVEAAACVAVVVVAAVVFLEEGEVLLEGAV